MAEPKAVFLSYASQDAAAARRICDALCAAGVEVWFDQSELRGGDSWDAKIRKQIRECALFIPLISANTQSRPEGYFRLEWRLADQRTHLMGKSKAFLLPVGIDDTRESDADVPDSFLAVQWTRVPRGEANAAFGQRVHALLNPPSTGKTPSPAPVVGDTESNPSGEVAKPSSKIVRWLLLTTSLTALAAAIWFPWKRRVPVSDRPGIAPATSETPNQREVRSLVAKAWEQMNQTGAFRGELEIADDLCRRATTLDPDSAEAWAAWSHVDCWHLYHGVDTSDARRESARKKSARALKLDPKSFEARFAEANYLVRGPAGSVAGAVPEHVENVVARLRELLAERPNEPRVWFALAILLRNDGKVAESAEAFDRMAATPAFTTSAKSEKGWMYWQQRKFAAALAACDESIALQPFRGNLLLRIYLALAWLGDLDLAQATLARTPTQLQMEDDFVAIRARVYWWRREPAEVRRIVASIPRSWITWGAMPRAYLLGEAHRLAGDEEAAQASWADALRETDMQIAQSPSARYTLRRARLLGLIGRHDESRQVLRRAKADGLPTEGPLFTEFRDWSISLSNGDLDEALDSLEKGYEANNGWAATWAMLRHNPLFDPLREHPRFKSLLARAAADPQRNPGAKDPTTPASFAPAKTALADKSIAVLAFENRSDDRDAEFFSDGISEELINLLGRVPGLTVKGRSSSFYFKGKEATAQEKGQKLGAAYLVDGSVRKVGPQVRITAQLIRAATDEVIWSSEPLTRELKDVLALQEDIARLIAQSLSLKLTDAPRTTKAVNPEAHRLVLEARHYWATRTEVDFLKAEKACLQAIEIDPQFAAAHAALADVYMSRGWWRRLDSRLPDREDFVRARTEAVQAQRMDSGAVEPIATLGAILYNERKFSEAEEHLTRALALNPNYASARFWHALLLWARGNLHSAMAEYERAFQLDPLSFALLEAYARILGYVGRGEEALSFSDRALSLQPNTAFARAERAVILWSLQRLPEAVEAARAVRDNPAVEKRRNADAYAIFVLRKAGLAGEAAEYAARVQHTLPEKSYLRGFVAAALDQLDDAWTHLETTPVPALHQLYFSPLFDSCRNKPQFIELMAKLGCTEEYKLARASLTDVRRGSPK